MNDQPPHDQPPHDQPPHDQGRAGRRTETDWQRRKRLAEVFGDVLPETTADEREPGSAGGGSEPGVDAGEAWLRAQVPPHHG